MTEESRRRVESNLPRVLADMERGAARYDPCPTCADGIVGADGKCSKGCGPRSCKPPADDAGRYGIFRGEGENSVRCPECGEWHCAHISRTVRFDPPPLVAGRTDAEAKTLARSLAWCTIGAAVVVGIAVAAHFGAFR